MTKRIVVSFVIVIASVIGWSILREIPPIAGLFWAVGIGAGFLWWHVRSGPGREERLALARISQPIGPLKWVWLAVGATISLIFGLSGFIELWGPTWSDWAPVVEGVSEILEYDTTLVGWIALGIWTIGVSPLAYEFCVRGYVQGALEERWSPTWAILVPAIATAALTGGLPHWSIALLMGLASLGSGVVAYRFQSIWPAVGVTAGSGALYFVLPMIHGDRLSNFGGLAPALLIPLSIALTLAGVVGWYLVLDRTKGPSGRGSPSKSADMAEAHTGA